jgi:peptidyl-prolyl cis-trans isomerase C
MKFKTLTLAFQRTCLVTACGIVLAGQSAFAQQANAAAPALPSELAMTINGLVLPSEQGDLLLREQLARGVPDTPQLRNAIRETRINQAVMAQDAIKLALDKVPQVKARVELAQQNALAQAWQQKMMQEAVFTEAELQAEYAAQVKALGTQEYQLRHVLVVDEKQAQQVFSKIKAGAKFEALALESSRDPGTRDKGGLSDWVAEGRLAPAIRQAVEGLKAGQLAAKPVQTPAGWQVLRLEEKRTLTPPTLEAVKPQLRQALAQRQLQAKLAALRSSAKVE